MSRKRSSASKHKWWFLCLLSVGSTIFYYETIGKENVLEVTKEIGKADMVQGVYVFVHSKPQIPYYTLEVLDPTALSISGSLGKLKDTLQSTLQFNRMTLNERLSGMVSVAKIKHPQADGVVFRQNLNQCEVVKFME